MFLSWMKGLTQVRTSAHDKQALKQLALNVHINLYRYIESVRIVYVIAAGFFLAI